MSSSMSELSYFRPLVGLFLSKDHAFWSPSTTVTVFLLASGLAVGNDRLDLKALLTDLFIHQAVSINFEKDESLKFSKKILYSWFMSCRHTLANTSSSTRSTQASALSWNILTYKSRSSPTYCRVRLNSVKVYFACAKKNLVLRAATICSQF